MPERRNKIAPDPHHGKLETREAEMQERQNSQAIVSCPASGLARAKPGTLAAANGQTTALDRRTAAQLGKPTLGKSGAAARDPKKQGKRSFRMWRREHPVTFYVLSVPVSLVLGFAIFELGALWCTQHFFDPFQDWVSTAITIVLTIWEALVVFANGTGAVME